MNLIAATTPERIGFFVAAFMVVGWIAYVFVAARQRNPEAPPGSEIELAPNRKPFLDDENLEGPRLERFLGWALLLLIVCSIAPLVYWLAEPSRQEGEVNRFDQQAVHRGESLFMPTDSPEHGAHFGCAGCHGGMLAEGGVTKFVLEDEEGNPKSVEWAAPRLDTVLAKFSKAEVRKILEFGRVNSPMPAWGVAGGGPMNDQQLDDLVAYLESIQLSDEKALEVAKTEAEAEATASGLSASSGEVLFRTNCARCHTKGWSYGEPEEQAGGAFGPSLLDGATLRQFPKEEDHIEFIKTGSEYGKPYGTRGMGGDEGGGMPGFAGLLTEAQIKAIVEYERGL